MRKKRIIVLLLLIGYLLFSLVFSVALQSSKDRSRQEFDLLLAERIYDAVENRFQGPIMVAKVMASDTMVHEMLAAEKDRQRQETEARFAAWLTGIQKSGDYDTVYLVSDSTRRYYTSDGIDKIVDQTKDSHDKWYEMFKNSNAPYVVSVDVDQVHDKEWTLFVDARITDDRGRFLGSCGVGVFISGLQELIREFEEEYNAHIQLVNSDGLVMVDTNTYNIETTHYGSNDLSEKDEYIYVPRGLNGSTVTKYVKDLDFFLVVQTEAGYQEKAMNSGIFWGELAAFAVIALGIMFTLRGGGGERSGERERSQTDPLTGLHNRNYFKDVYGERGVFNTTRYKTIAVFDIDFFKEINDTMDGDAILVMVADCARKYLGDQGDIYRWGGDEFVVLMQWSVDFAYEICREFCKDIEKDGRATVSVGITEVRLSDTIKKNYYRAAQGCYLVKEMGGNGVKRE